MSRNLKFFLITFILSLPFWWEVNVLEKDLEDFFYWHKVSENPQILTAQITAELEFEALKPFRNIEVENLELGVKSAISVFVNSKGEERVLYEKAINEKMPIASLAKLMTANIVLENYDLSQIIEISEKAVAEEEGFGEIKVGEIFRVKDLLYPLLMESSNDAAYALAELIGLEAFVELMNLEAEKLGLENTYFVNSTGLDPEESKDSINYSSSEDLVELTKYLLEKPLIWEILATPEFDLYSPDRVFHHKLFNTNELLGKDPRIVWGKTGYTEEAQGCLLLVMKTPEAKSYLINIILGSGDRFEEMEKLINWLDKAYRW